MVSIIQDLPRKYRERAEEARAQADETTDPERRRALLQVADTWERMAQYEEKHPSVPRSHYVPPED